MKQSSTRVSAITRGVSLALAVSLLIVHVGAEVAAQQGSPVCVVVIDQDGVGPGISTIQASAGSHNQTADELFNIPAIDNSSPLPWNQNFPGDVVLLPAGKVDDEGWFALPADTPWSWQDFVAGTVSQGQLASVPNVMPLRNQDLHGLTQGGQTCVAVVYDGDINLSYGPLTADLRGERYGLFSFTVLAMEVPGSIRESWSTTSLYDVWVRVEEPRNATTRFDVTVRDHPADVIQMAKATYDSTMQQLRVHAESDFAPGAFMTMTVDGLDGGSDPGTAPMFLERPMVFNPPAGRYEVILTTPTPVLGLRVLISTDEGGSFHQNIIR